jgi:carboxyl-terminal processing protease
VLLAAVAKNGTLEVSAADTRGNAVPADVLIDGRKVGSAPGKFTVPLCAERIDVESSAIGRWSDRAPVQENKTVPVRAVLKSSAFLVEVPEPEGFSGIAKETMRIIEEEYIDASRARPEPLLEAALIGLQSRVAGFGFERSGDKLIVRYGNAKTNVSMKDLIELNDVAERLEPVFELFSKSNARTFGRASIEVAALNAALAHLDSESRILTPAEHDASKATLAGRVGGIGVDVGIHEGVLKIVEPIDNSPSAKAGMRAGDVITQVDGTLTAGLPIDEAVALLRGPIGSPISVSIMRPGWARPQRFELVRGTAEPKQVEHQLLSGDIGLIRLKSLGPDIPKQLTSSLERLERRTPLKGVVLDLRECVSGSLEIAAEIADRFLASGDIFTTASRKTRSVKTAKPSADDLTDRALAVIVGRATSPAAELLAGALAGHDRAIVLGETTRGRSSFTASFPLPFGFAVSLKIGEHLTTGGRRFDGDGIVPDIALRAVSNGAEEDVDANTLRFAAADPARARGYPVELARAVLERGASSKRSATLKAAHGVIERERDQERRRVTSMR